MDENAEIIEAQAVDIIEMTADIVSAYVSNNPVRPSDMPNLLASVHAAVAGLRQGSAPEAPTVEKFTPSQIRKSITPDALISFIDGKPYKTLKRHVTGNGMTFEQYRERFGLPRDYPSTAASYSEQRSALAKSLGLGQQRKKAAPKAAEHAETVSDKPKRAAGRPRKAKEATEA
ncbi:MucR family transcriptional regulator [Methylobacterium sp. J-077]|uniref:MucR family transcriptional regulator n=1 Tax=Methylobacterium sp. J-077 TaxID=2836656 RepID=UPI001FB8A445|nr:MucR family transcriptional regulator [Methylobacterium sp. J-077]MCJ2126431.1 MucR family transcriptional regulator [Methylobacterium sp. J-077]